MKIKYLLIALILVLTVGCSKETTLTCTYENDYSDIEVKGIPLNNTETKKYYFHENSDKPYKAEVVAKLVFKDETDLNTYLEYNKDSGSTKNVKDLTLTEAYTLEYTDVEIENLDTKEELISKNNTCK